MQKVRIYEMPPCRMVSSGVGMFGEANIDRFMEWHSMQKTSMFPKDFLFWDDSNPDGQGFHWLYMHEPEMCVPEGLEIIDFPGGLYAVATDIDQRTDKAAMDAEVMEFLQANGLKIDGSRKELGNVISSPQVGEILGYEQMNYYYPVCPA